MCLQPTALKRPQSEHHISSQGDCGAFHLGRRAMQDNAPVLVVPTGSQHKTVLHVLFLTVVHFPAARRALSAQLCP